MIKFGENIHASVKKRREVTKALHCIYTDHLYVVVIFLWKKFKNLVKVDEYLTIFVSSLAFPKLSTTMGEVSTCKKYL